MEIEVLVKIFTEVIGGLGIFLLGMKHMSEGMQAVAGDGLRRMISAVTNNRLLACGVGTLVTCVIQSSSVTTVMVVGLVNGNFMTLTQAIGVIMGANIGTTITGWILVLKIGKYGLPVLGIAAIFYLFVRKDRIRYTALTIMGIGMVFFGLELMSSGFKPLRTLPAFVEWFHRFQADSYFGVLKCAMAGCLLTMVVQSSSATLGITIGLAEAGMIPYSTAAALVLGENIGTTITALLASLGATTNARRAALSHTIFNISGVLVITMFPIFLLYTGAVTRFLGLSPDTAQLLKGEQVFPHMRAAIAATHSGFNIINTLIFLPLLPLLARIVTRVMPDRDVKEVPHLNYLNVRMLDTPAIGIQQSHDQVAKMGADVKKMLDWIGSVWGGNASTETQQKLFRREEILDVVEKEVVEFLSRMVTGNVTQDIMTQARRQLRMADEYESVSDYIAQLQKLHIRLKKNALSISSEGMLELVELHRLVASFVVQVNGGLKDDIGSTEAFQREVHERSREIKRHVKEMRKTHLARVQDGSAEPLKTLIFTDILASYRKIVEHAINIAEAMAE